MERYAIPIAQEQVVDVGVIQRSQLGSKRTYTIYENHQRYHPHGECFCLTQPMLENIREKRNRQDMISHTNRQNIF